MSANTIWIDEGGIHFLIKLLIEQSKNDISVSNAKAIENAVIKHQFYKNENITGKFVTDKNNNKKIKNYKKKFDEAERASNLADQKWNEVGEQYKALGKNRIERIMKATKNNTAEAKAYTKAFDEASRLSDFADTKWNEVSRAYAETGKNRISRVLNNVRY